MVSAERLCKLYRSVLRHNQCREEASSTELHISRFCHRELGIIPDRDAFRAFTGIAPSCAVDSFITQRAEVFHAWLLSAHDSEELTGHELLDLG